MKTVIIFGPPGSGKGTQANLIAKKKGYLHLSTGDALRKEISSGSDLGKRIDEIISQGHLAPDDMMIEMIGNFFGKNPNRDIILDGFPRTVHQAGELYKILGRIDRKEVYVVNLDLTDEEVVKRLLLRAKSQGRNDDTEKIIKERLKVYHTQTEPILDFYEGKYSVYNINGIGAVEKINGDILDVLS